MSESEPKVGIVLPKSLSSAVDAAALLDQLVGAVRDLVHVTNEEKTKRATIHARENVLVSEIEAERDLLIAYLDRSFDERAHNFHDLFGVLDSALKQAPEQVPAVLSAITDLAASSPFKDLQDRELTRKRWDDPDHEFTV